MVNWILSTLPLAALVAAQRPRYGPYVSLGPTQSEILSMETVFTPGQKQKNPDYLLFLWPGISDAAVSGGDLIQTVAESHPGNARDCGAPQGYWCISP
jgi:hypothetical protein